jgi:hypothetical protein
MIATSLPVAIGMNIPRVKGGSETGDKEVSVDSNIYLTRGKLPLLQRAVTQIDNPEIKQFVQKIITELQGEDIVTSVDIQKIVDTLPFPVRIRTGPLLCYGPGVLQATWWFPRGIVIGAVGWSSSGLTISGWLPRPTIVPQTGFAIGFIGLASEQGSRPPWVYILGFSFLTIILLEK